MVQVLATLGEFEKTIADAGDKLVVVDFTASWCPPCQMIKPKFHELAEKETGSIFVAVDVDENDETAAKVGIACMPTFLFFKGGKQVHKIEGADLNSINQAVEKFK